MIYPIIHHDLPKEECISKCSREYEPYSTVEKIVEQIAEEFKKSKEWQESKIRELQIVDSRKPFGYEVIKGQPILLDLTFRYKLSGSEKRYYFRRIYNIPNYEKGTIEFISKHIVHELLKATNKFLEEN